MAKIKLSLPSGSGVEKTVISYFNNGGNYLILDAESVGSMGLPIILVSKVDNDKVVKISDQNEWQQVKAHLKTIISGGQMVYIKAPDSLPADEVYYTQLTLPVASFDALKKNYVVPEAASETKAAEEPKPETVEDAVANATGNVEAAPVVATEAEEPKPDSGIDNSIMESTTPIANPATDEAEPVNMAIETPSAEAAPASAAEVPIANPIVGGDAPKAEEPIANEGLNAVTTEEMVAPVVAAEPVVQASVEQQAESGEAPVLDVTQVITEPVVQAPVETPAPIVETASGVTSPDVDELKKKFISACEEAFDTLAKLITK